MNLYLISQDVNGDYDSYDSAVVMADSEEAALMTHPGGETGWDGQLDIVGDWCDVSDVSAKLLGIAIEGSRCSVVCSSFNAG